MVRLSFIVPVYGVEKYIEECIHSLYNQDIPQSEYEVICVDDCSPDGSRAIVERLQKEYSTLHLICHAENKRQGGARNTGLREAKGQYIWFVDSDDYLLPNGVGTLLSQAEKDDLDILQMPLNDIATTEDFGICTGSQYAFDLPIDEAPVFRCSVVWRSIIKKDLLIKNNIWFAEHVQYEDDDYAYLMFAHAKRVRFVPHTIYKYRRRSDSATGQAYSLLKMYYFSQQIRRLIENIEWLVTVDSRWEDMTQRIVTWICHEQILTHMKYLSINDRRKFYSSKMGHIVGLRHYVRWRVWLAMHYYCFCKWLYLK